MLVMAMMSMLVVMMSIRGYVDGGGDVDDDGYGYGDFDGYGDCGCDDDAYGDVAGDCDIWLCW